MNKLGVFFTVFLVAMAFCCENAEGADKFAKELFQNFEGCSARLPISISEDGVKWVAEQTRWYMQYSNEIFWSRLADVYLTGKENVPVSQVRGFFDSPCITLHIPQQTTQVVQEQFQTTNTVEQQYQSVTLGVTLSVATTIQPSGLFTSVFHLPNSQLPGLTVNWLGVLTNQRTYALFMSCLPEGHLGFQVFATVPELDAASKHEITQYLEHAGFPDNLSSITTYRASTCTNAP